MFKKIYRFFDKLEDRIRGRLSHYPIFYALIGGIGVVLFWRGTWHTADLVAPVLFSGPDSQWYPQTPWQFLDGPITLFVSIILLLMTGVFVSGLIGNEIIITGLKHEKKIAEKTEQEIAQEFREEEASISIIRGELESIHKELEEIKNSIKRG
jgi:hypothetical protein